MLTLDHQKAVLERIQQIPIMETLGLQIESLEEGRCRGILPRKPGYDGIYDSLHGGLLMCLADTVACFAILTQVDQESVVTTTDMSIRFLAPCLTDVVADAKVIKLGRSLCPVQVDLYDKNQKLVAIAQVTYMRLEKMPSRDKKQANTSSNKPAEQQNSQASEPVQANPRPEAKAISLEG